MARDPPFWRLGRPLQRPFSILSNAVAYVLILTGLTGVTFFTIFTKGYPMQCYPQAQSSQAVLSDPSLLAHCAPTIIYPGQMISTSESSFTFQLDDLSNLTKPLDLRDCRLQDDSSIYSLISSPQPKFDLRVVCGSDDIASFSSSNSTITNQALVQDQIRLSIPGLHPGPEAQSNAQNLTAEITKGLNIQPFSAYPYDDLPDSVTIYGARDPPIVSWDNSKTGTGIWSDPPTFGPSEVALMGFFNMTWTWILQDLHKIAPLPTQPFNCQSCSRKFIPPLQMLWTVIVALGSTWSLILFLASAIAQRMNNPFDSSYRVCGHDGTRTIQNDVGTPEVGGGEKPGSGASLAPGKEVGSQASLHDA